MLAPYLIPPVVVLAFGLPAIWPLMSLGRPASMRACSCGYALEGLPSGVCPECGATHEATWAAFQVRRRRLAAFLWTTATAFALAAGAFAAHLTAPTRSDRRSHALFTYPSPGTTRCDLEFEWTASGPPDAERFTGGAVTYSRGGREERVEIPGPAGRPQDEETAAAREVADLITRLGTPYADHPEEYTRAVGQALIGVMQHPSQRTASDLRANSFGGGSRAMTTLEPKLWTLAAALPMWALGLRAITRRKPAEAPTR